MKRTAAAALLLALVACSSGAPALDKTYEAARVALRRGELVQARELTDRGMRASAQPESAAAWRFRLLRAEIDIYDNRLADARRLLASPVPGGSAFDAVRARAEYLRAKIKTAEGAIAEALDILTRVSPASADDALDLAELGGQLRLRLGRWDEGDRVLEEVATRAARSGDSYHEALALNDLGMGNVVRHRYDEAASWFERVVGHPELEAFTIYPRALYNAGLCYTRLGQFDRAVAAQRRAVEAYARRGAARDREEALGQLGSTLLAQGRAREGIEHLANALDVARGADLQDDAAIWAGNLAAANIDLRDWQSARRYNDEARRIKVTRGSKDLVHNTLNDAQIAAGIGDRASAERLFRDALAAGEPADVVWEAHAGLADLAVAGGQRARANEHSQAALDTIEATRSDLLKSDYKVSFLSRLIRFYQAYVNTLVDEHQFVRALEIADASRARVLAEREGVAPPRRADAMAFRRLAGRSGAVLLSYWLAEERSYLWVVTAAGVDMVPLPPAREIETLVRAHQAAIASALGDPLAGPLSGAAGERLFDLLVAPALKSISAGARVVVVPDGILHGLNFETLIVAGPRRHYWIEDAQVEVAPSLAMLTVDASAVSRSASVLEIGNAVARPPEFQALTYSPVEMRAVASHFGPDRVERLEGERASPSAYRDARPDRFTFVHFAAHATTSFESPLDSAIILSGPDGSYKLYARDVAEQPLHAELVTVSACRSAGERAYAGEGLVGLAWAFLHAGARHVVAGLWDVDDRATSELMDGLYARLAAGEPAGTALREAKLAQLARGGTGAKPYYWAPFELFTVALPTHPRKP